MEPIIRQMALDDITACAEVHRIVFGKREFFSREWIRSNFAASLGKFRHVHFFVGEIAGEVVSYIFWLERGGLRQKAIMELDQIAVHPHYQGLGIGKTMTIRSLIAVKNHLALRDAGIGKLMIFTRADNFAARELYRKVLNAEAEATIKDLFTSDEILMVVRELPKWLIS